MTASPMVYATTATVPASSAAGWASTANATGANNGTYAVFTTAVSTVDGILNMSGFSPVLGGTSTTTTIDSIDVTVWHWVAATARWNSVVVGIMNPAGTTNISSAVQGTMSTTTTFSQTFSWTTNNATAAPFTWADIQNGLVIRLDANKKGTQSSTYNVDAVGLVVNYTTLTFPVVDAGADLRSTIGSSVVRTANETGGNLTSRSWVIQSGPTGVGTTIGTTATLTWTPSVVGTYTIRYSATNSVGTGTDDVVVTVYDPTITLPYTETFTGTNGSPLPDPWTALNGSGTGGSALIQNNAGQINAGTTAYGAEWAYLIGMPGGTTDIDVVGTFSATTNNTESYIGIGISCDNVPYTSDGSFPANGYVFKLNYPTATSGFSLDKMLTNTRNAVVPPTGTVTHGTTYSMRVQRTGTIIRGRYWIAGTTEPSTWNISYTDPGTMVSAGRVMLVTQNGAGTAINKIALWDDVTVTPVNAPIVDAGADATLNLGDTFTRTAIENSVVDITDRHWNVASGPSQDGFTISTTAEISWTPAVAGTYVLQYAATNPSGQGSDFVTVTVNAGGPTITTVTGSLSVNAQLTETDVKVTVASGSLAATAGLTGPAIKIGLTSGSLAVGAGLTGPTTKVGVASGPLAVNIGLTGTATKVAATYDSGQFLPFFF